MISQLIDSLFIVNRIKQANVEMKIAITDEIGNAIVNAIEYESISNPFGVS
jgi:hypothetical protein